MKLSYLTSRYGLRFDVDTFLARLGLYRWLMWKVFGRRYYQELFKSGLLGDWKPEYMVFFKRKD